MAGLSSNGETTVLNSLTGGGTPISYVSLHTADPADTGGSEVTGGAYARMGPVAFTDSGNNPTTAANNAIITFPAATAAWGTINFFGVWSAPTGGSFLGSGAVTTPKVVGSGDTARFAQGALTIKAD